MSSSRPVRVAPATRARDALARLVPLLSVLGGFLPAVALASTETPPPATAPAVAPLDLTPLVAHATALHLLADRLDLAGDARAVTVRQAAVEAAPAALSERFALIETALRVGDYAAAQRAADEVDAIAPSAPEMVFLRAAIDFASGFPAQAEARLSRDPAHLSTLAIDASILDLRYGKRSDADAARRRLTKLYASQPAQLRVRQELICDALRRKATTEVLALRAASSTEPTPSFADQIQAAELARVTQPGQPVAEIAGLLGTQVQTPADAALFTAWLVAQNETTLASSWLESLPAATRALPALRGAEAHLLVVRRQWDQAWPLLEKGAWGAPLSAAARAGDWTRAVQASAGDLDALRALYALSLTVDTSRPREQVLAAIIATHHEQSWAYQTLANLRRQRDDTAALAALYAQWHEADPDNITVESNRLLLDVLVSRKASTQLRSTIEKVLMFHPEQPILGLARALALWQNGRKEEAFETTDSLAATARHRAPQALYHGLFAAAAGQRSDYVQGYLSVAQKSHLLPEEHELLVLAQTTAAKPAP